MPKYKPIHGQSQTRLFRIWAGMVSRCYNPNRKKYVIYGGRGIKICDRWLEPDGQGFMNFSEDMKEGYEPHLSIERKDNDGDYTKENCRWATNQEQARNRTTSRFIEYKGERKTLAEWSDITGMCRATIAARIGYGWDLDKVFNQPLRNK